MTSQKLRRRAGTQGAWAGALLVAALAMLGGLIGLIASVLIASRGDLSWEGLVQLITGTTPSGDFAAILGAWGFVSAGAIVGGYLALLVLRLTHPGLVCPRCGTSNAASASVCEACDLELR
jgi:hypothetical protein